MSLTESPGMKIRTRNPGLIRSRFLQYRRVVRQNQVRQNKESINGSEISGLRTFHSVTPRRQSTHIGAIECSGTADSGTNPKDEYRDTSPRCGFYIRC